MPDYCGADERRSSPRIARCHGLLISTAVMTFERDGLRLLARLEAPRSVKGARTGLANVLQNITLLGRFDEQSRTITGALSPKKVC